MSNRKQRFQIRSNPSWLTTRTYVWSSHWCTNQLHKQTYSRMAVAGLNCRDRHQPGPPTRSRSKLKLGPVTYGIMQSKIHWRCGRCRSKLELPSSESQSGQALSVLRIRSTSSVSIKHHKHHACLLDVWSFWRESHLCSSLVLLLAYWWGSFCSVSEYDLDLRLACSRRTRSHNLRMRKIIQPIFSQPPPPPSPLEKFGIERMCWNNFTAAELGPHTLDSPQVMIASSLRHSHSFHYYFNF